MPFRLDPLAQKFQQMQTNRESLLSKAAEAAYDTVVIGGGVTGVCAAWEAAARGLRVLLLERADFGAATSAHSLKILHGGIRYLQHLDLPRLRESCRERSIFLQMAPHLTAHKSFVVPTFGHGMQGKHAFRAALGLLAVLTADRNARITDPSRRAPVGHTISRDELRKRFPGITDDAANGAAVFYDGVLLNPPRLVFEIAQTAVDAGAIALNYCNVTRVRIDDKKNVVHSVAFRDEVAGREYEVRTKSVINAAGPYAPGVGVTGNYRLPDAPYSRDMAIVVDQLYDDPAALAVQTRYRDPDAVISRGNRHLFMVPWRQYTLIGVNSRVYRDSADALRVDNAELAAFIDEINEACPQLSLSEGDVRVVNAGLLPFGDNQAGAEHLSFGKRSLVFNATANGGPRGYTVAISNRWTMGRKTGEAAVDAIEAHLRGRRSPVATSRCQIRSSQYESVAALRQAIRRDSAFQDLSTAQIDSVATNYGSLWPRLAALGSAAPEMSEPIENTTTLKGQVVYAARYEMVANLADIVLRRTDIGTGETPSDAALSTCADIAAIELGWSDARKRQEIESVRQHYHYSEAAPAAPVERIAV